jgi:hypothetical protein
VLTWRTNFQNIFWNQPFNTIQHYPEPKFKNQREEIEEFSRDLKRDGKYYGSNDLETYSIINAMHKYEEFLKRSEKLL